MSPAFETLHIECTHPASCIRAYVSVLVRSAKTKVHMHPRLFTKRERYRVRDFYNVWYTTLIKHI